jgi:hypothetical protein
VTPKITIEKEFKPKYQVYVTQLSMIPLVSLIENPMSF